MRLMKQGTLIASGAALAGAALVFGLSLSGALARPGPDPFGSPPAPGTTTEVPSEDVTEIQPRAVAAVPQDAETASDPPSTPTGPGDLSPEVLELAVDEAPFEADRRAPARRYRLPTEEVRPEPEPVELPPAPEFQLLGAVAAPTGGFVVLRVDGDEPRMVSTGESVEGYTLASVEADRAVMEGLGRTLEVELVGASPVVEEDDEDDDRRRRFRRDRDDDDDDDDDRSEVQRTQEEFLERARDALQQLQGQPGGGQVNLGQDGSITIVRPGGTSIRDGVIVPRALIGGSP